MEILYHLLMISLYLGDTMMCINYSLMQTCRLTIVLNGLKFGGFTLTNILHGNTISLMLTQTWRDHCFLSSKWRTSYQERVCEHCILHYHTLTIPMANLCWGNARKTALHRSIVLQKRALRIVNNANYNGHTVPHFKACRISKLNDLYEHKALLFLFDYITNQLPLSFVKTFQFNRDHLVLRLTRQADMIHIARCPLQFTRRLPLYVPPEIWNKQPRSQMNVNNLSRSQFKYQIKAKYLNNYQSRVRCMIVRYLDCYHILSYSLGFE